MMMMAGSSSSSSSSTMGLREWMTDLKVKLPLMGKLHAAHALVVPPGTKASSTTAYDPAPEKVAGADPGALTKFAAAMAAWRVSFESVNATDDLNVSDDLRNMVFDQAWTYTPMYTQLSEAWAAYKTEEDKITAASPTPETRKKLVVDVDDFIKELRNLRGTSSACEKAQRRIVAQISKYPDVGAIEGIRVNELSSSTPEYRGYGNMNSGLTSQQADRRAQIIQVCEEVRAKLVNMDIPVRDMTMGTWEKYAIAGGPGLGVIDSAITKTIGLQNLYVVAAPALAKYLRDAGTTFTKIARELKGQADKAGLADVVRKLVDAVALLSTKTVLNRGPDTPTTFDQNSADLMFLIATLETNHATEIPVGALRTTGVKYVPGKGGYRSTLPGSGTPMTSAMSSSSPGAAGLMLTGSRAKNGFQRVPGSQVATYVSDGIMYRAPDMVRIQAYRDAAAAFASTMRSTGFYQSVELLAKRAKATINGLVEGMQRTAKLQGGEVLNEVRAPVLAAQKMAIARGFVRTVRGHASRYVRIHALFAVRHNRAALKYMAYWDAFAGLSIPEVAEFYSSMALVVQAALDEITKVVDAVKELFAEAGFSDGMTDVQIVEMTDVGDGLLVHLRERVFPRVQALHTGTGPSVVDVVVDPRTMTVYALKVIRGVSALLAATLASRVFRSMYAQRVYVEQRGPPSPFVFLLLIAGIELGITAVIALLLSLTARMAASTPDFPIDSDLVVAWLTDVVATTVFIYGISAIFAAVVQSKKYFRYSQEGDRGVRALATLVLWTYLVVLLLPLFRLAS